MTTTAFNTPGIGINADAPSFRVEVLAAGESQFTGNGLRFTTVEGAEAYAVDLYSRWTAVTAWRIVDCFDPPNRGVLPAVERVSLTGLGWLVSSEDK